MDMTALTTAISTLGFPIAMCLIMFYYLQKESENHKEEVTKLKDAINNNTSIMEKLVMLLTKGDKSNE